MIMRRMMMMRKGQMAIDVFYTICEPNLGGFENGP